MMTVLFVLFFAALGAAVQAQSKDTVILRGRPQEVRVYGARGSGDPVVVSSGDGGWVHLAPHVAEVLAAKGFFVIGFDVKTYLESFTSATSTLRPEDEPGDFRTLIAYAVIGLGLPDMNELGWRWRDAMIYLTHGFPNEPMFSAAALAGNVAPVPLAAIHSTNDEFVPLADVERVFMAAKEPKKLWVVRAANRRFSDNLPEFNQRLLDAIEWLKGHQPG